MPKPRYRLFISHSYDHFQIYLDLLRLLDRSRLKYQNMSIQRDMRLEDSLPQDELKAAFARSLRNSEVLLVLNKPIVATSPLIQWEVRYALRLGMSVLGIRRARTDNTSNFVRQHATDLLEWDPGRLARTVREHAERFRKMPDAERAELAIKADAELQDARSVQPDEAVDASEEEPGRAAWWRRLLGLQ